MTMNRNQSRLIKRKLAIRPRFHETDMMGVVHNAEYLCWFEEGRLQIMLEILSLARALELGVAMPVIRVECDYKRPVRFGDSLILYTTHHILPVYEGRLVFRHSLVHEKQKTEMAGGETVATLVDAQTSQLVKEWPPDIWAAYQALR